MTTPDYEHGRKYQMHQVHAALYDANTKLFEAINHFPAGSNDWIRIMSSIRMNSELMWELFTTWNLGGSNVELSTQAVAEHTSLVEHINNPTANPDAR